MTLPNKTTRPGTFDHSPLRYQWQAGRIPDEILKNGTKEPSPFLKNGLFVVHGIGDQKDTDTAVSMRLGIEDSIPKIEPSKNTSTDSWIVPPPYINDGHWAKYTDLESFLDDIREDWNKLSRRQQTFFNNFWAARQKGWFQSWKWVVRQGATLFGRGSLGKKPLYAVLTLLLAVFVMAAGLHPKSRKFIVLYVNDARLYLEPRGDMELEIVQLIDRRIARRFLGMIGLDIEFGPLEKGTNADKSVVIGGAMHEFEEVTWVAHSLGTIISFNVIGDLLRKCIEIRKDADSPDYEQRLAATRKVEKALARFVTLGSPLDKIVFLCAESSSPHHNTVLRRWPHEYLPGGARDIRFLHGHVRSVDADGFWWLNGFYGSDPISGPLGDVERLMGISKTDPLIRNISTLRWRPPFASHIKYWTDTGFVTKILEQTYRGYTKTVVHRFLIPWPRKRNKSSSHYVRSWPEWMHNILSSFGLFWITVIILLGVVWAWQNWEQIIVWLSR